MSRVDWAVVSKQAQEQVKVYGYVKYTLSLISGAEYHVLEHARLHPDEPVAGITLCTVRSGLGFNAVVKYIAGLMESWANETFPMEYLVAVNYMSEYGNGYVIQDSKRRYHTAYNGKGYVLPNGGSMWVLWETPGMLTLTEMLNQGYTKVLSKERQAKLALPGLGA